MIIAVLMIMICLFLCRYRQGFSQHSIGSASQRDVEFLENWPIQNYENMRKPHHANVSQLFRDRTVYSR